MREFASDVATYLQFTARPEHWQGQATHTHTSVRGAVNAEVQPHPAPHPLCMFKYARMRTTGAAARSVCVARRPT